MPYKDKQKEREAKLRWYYAHKGVYRQNEIQRRSVKRQYINSIKDVPCYDCKQRYPSFVMDFDHREGRDKLLEVTRLIGYGLETIKKEIAKCDVVCSNCHRIRTFTRLISSTDRAPVF